MRVWCPHPPRAFTLIEILVVTAILALLISILLPSLTKAKEEAKAVVCMTRQRGLGTAFQTFVAEHKGHYPECELWFDALGEGYKFGWWHNNRPEFPDYRPPNQGGTWDAPFGPNQRGYISRYMASDINAFMCPKDDGYRLFKGWGLPGTPIAPHVEFMAMPPRLSYMMNSDLQYLNGITKKDILGHTVYYSDSVLLQTPSKVMLLMEEDAFTPMNDPWVEYRTYAFNDTDERVYANGWLGNRHSGRGSLLFFDNHVELLATDRFNGGATIASRRAANRLSGLLFDSLYITGEGGIRKYKLRTAVTPRSTDVVFSSD